MNSEKSSTEIISDIEILDKDGSKINFDSFDSKEKSKNRKRIIYESDSFIDKIIGNLMFLIAVPFALLVFGGTLLFVLAVIVVCLITTGALWLIKKFKRK